MSLLDTHCLLGGKYTIDFLTSLHLKPIITTITVHPVDSGMRVSHILLQFLASEHLLIQLSHVLLGLLLFATVYHLLHG